MDAANEIDFLTGSGSANFSRNLRTSSLERRRRAGSGPSPRHESGSVLGSGPAPLIQPCSGELQNTDRCSSLNSGSACSRIRPPGRDTRTAGASACSGCSRVLVQTANGPNSCYELSLTFWIVYLTKSNFILMEFHVLDAGPPNAAPVLFWVLKEGS